MDSTRPMHTSKREREREHFLYRKNMHKMEEIEWQIYNKMMRIERAKITKIKGKIIFKFKTA